MHLLELLQFLLIEPLVLLNIVLIILLILLLILNLLLDAGSIGDPIVDLLLVGLPHVALLNAVLLLRLSPQIEHIVDVVHLVVGLANMLLESLQLEVYLKPLLAADVAVRGLVLCRCVAFLSQLSEFIDDGA